MINIDIAKENVKQIASNYIFSHIKYHMCYTMYIRSLPVTIQDMDSDHDTIAKTQSFYVLKCML